ncbi:MAG: DMT family transporter [Alphaproteobacteria bacterium]|nr:DMT family transporter [Alphaproteobacteria bacterium]MBV9371783.1 DMT family transporter [Alphaproteobacteria bacterium]MBV9901932.1 DMT family transporter [Alphaproteobacteria bacterium]
MHQNRSSSDARATRLAFPALLLGNLILAVGPWMVRLADVGPVASGFWRLAIAIPFLALFALGQQRGREAPSAPLVAMVAAGGLFFAADLAAWHVGIGLTKLANASLFGNSSSFILVVYGFVALRRLPRKVQLLALLCAAAGAALLMGSSYEASPAHFTGDLFTLTAGLFYTGYLVAVDRARRTMAPMPVLAIATTAGALPLLILANLLGQKVLPGDWTPLVILSIGSQVIGQGLLVYAVGYLSPVVVGLGLLAQPAAGAVIGRLAYGETMSLADAAGAVLIAAALVLIRLPERKADLATGGAQDH